jgi:predicted transcriptional regulator
MARPKHLLVALGLSPTAANRAAISRSLQRLCVRGDVQSYSGSVASQGRGYFYALTPTETVAGHDGFRGAR